VLVVGAIHGNELAGIAAFTVELPAGSLAPRQLHRQIRTVLALAAGR
jgi:hypothetical protein